MSYYRRKCRTCSNLVGTNLTRCPHCGAALQITHFGKYVKEVPIPDNAVYKYTLFRNPILWIAKIALSVVMIQGTPFFAGEAVKEISQALAGKPLDMGLILLSGLMCAGAALIVSAVLNEYCNLRLTDDSLDVQVFLFWWVSVPWQKVLRIKPVIGLQGAVFGHQIVIVDKLTFAHRVFGLQGGTLNPGIKIHPRLHRFYEVVEVIQYKTRTH